MQISKTSFTLTISIAEEEQDFFADVGYVYHRPIKGQREKGSGIPLEPDEPESAEIQYCRVDFPLKSQLDVTAMLSDKQLRAMEEAILAEGEE